MLYFIYEYESFPCSTRFIVQWSQFLDECNNVLQNITIQTWKYKDQMTTKLKPAYHLYGIAFSTQFQDHYLMANPIDHCIFGTDWGVAKDSSFICCKKNSFILDPDKKTINPGNNGNLHFFRWVQWWMDRCINKRKNFQNLLNVSYLLSSCGSQIYYRVACHFQISLRVGERQVSGESNIRSNVDPLTIILTPFHYFLPISFY